MIIGVHITKEGWPAAPKQAVKEAVGEAGKDLAFYWHETYLARHFEESANRRYDYQDRTKGYQRRKQREKGHNRPLMYTGTLARALEARAEVRQVGETTTLIMSGRGCQALNFAGKMRQYTVSTDGITLRNGRIVKEKTKIWRQYPDTPAEITTVMQSEANDMARRAQERAVGVLNAFAARQSRAL